jgi:histidyl-tRNA synthetase
LAGRFKAPRGTYDVLPGAMERHEFVYRTAGRILEQAGFGLIETPIFEETGLFERGVGDSTDIVRKEMFTFEDKGERSLTLRPEGTAPICRAYIEHGMSKLPQPVKLGYSGPFFRHERPQAGRYREFHQLGAEVIGTDSPLADAEVVILLDSLVRELGIPGVTLKINSLGSGEAREKFTGELTEYLKRHEADLSSDVRERIDSNPLRAFDSDDDGTREVMEGAPSLLDSISREDREHFERVRELLTASGVEHEVDPTLVRGLDYYSKTVFSMVCDRLGAQSEIGGGGRYDDLVGLLGGPDTPAVGWAAGVERLLLALDSGDEVGTRPVDLFLAVASDGDWEKAFALIDRYRNQGLSVELDLAGRRLKGQLKQADRSGAPWALILNEDGTAELKAMDSGEQRTVDPVDVPGLVKS